MHTDQLEILLKCKCWLGDLKFRIFKQTPQWSPSFWSLELAFSSKIISLLRSNAVFACSGLCTSCPLFWVFLGATVTLLLRCYCLSYLSDKSFLLLSFSFSRLGFPWWFSSNESTCDAGNASSIPWWGRFPGEGNGNALLCSCLENPVNRGVWWATVHGATESWTNN